MRQTADAVLMIRPAAFGFNTDAALSNALQAPPAAGEDVAAAARAEFDAFARTLLGEGVNVLVVDDTALPAKPDALFPNNWISFHADGTVVLYPMQPASRRAERRREVLEAVRQGLRHPVSRVLDLSGHEAEGRFLEGTGSLVLDHVQRVAYACISPRTDPGLVEAWCAALGYQPLCFAATDAAGRPWYHTNVMLSVGTQHALVAAESIEGRDRARVLAQLDSSGREIIEIDRAAVGEFVGNVLELGLWDEAFGDSRLLVMSARARAALDARDYARLAATVDSLLIVPVPTIERVGGGGVRCMLAEVFR